MTNTKTQKIQELRRSNASQPIPAKKVRRERSRTARRSADIRRSREGN